MSRGDHLETERKYNAGPDFHLPGFAGLPGVAEVSPPQRQRLTATYFDTAGLRLAVARITLRRRTGGQDAGWHLKLPVTGDTRREVRLPAGRPDRPVPAELAERVREWSRGEELVPVAHLRTIRIVRRLLGGDGTVLAEVADDRVSAQRAVAAGPGQAPVGRPGQAPAGRPGEAPPGPPGEAPPGRPGEQSAVHWQEPLTWREIEIELAAGGQDLLEAAGQRLTAAGAVPASSASKLHRLLGPQVAAASRPPTPAGG